MPNWIYNVLGAHDEHGIKFIFDKLFYYNIPFLKIYTNQTKYDTKKHDL